MKTMSIEGIAALIVSLAALGGTVATFYKARSEKRKSMADVGKTSADIEKSNAETIVLLSGQLQDAYTQIANLRTQIDDLNSRRDYEEYLLRGIARLTASLAANELSVPWIPLSFPDFTHREEKKR